MKLRTRLLVYLALVHALMAGLGVVLLAQDRRWLFAVEGLVAVSFLTGVVLIRKLSLPFDLAHTGMQLLADGDFTTRFRAVGHPELDGLVGVYNAMAERLHEERLRVEERNQLLAKLVGASPAAILLCDLDGRIAMANDAAAMLLGSGVAELAGRTVAAAGGAELGTALAALAPGQSDVVPGSGLRRLKISRGEFVDRGFPRSFYVLEELTHELRAGERAAYEKLVRMVSHEVNNSCAAVGSLLESSLAWADELPPGRGETFRQATTVAAARLRRLNEFVAGFAEVVRLPPPEPRPFDAGALLDDILILFGPELERRAITARWRERAADAMVRADKNQIEQALLNVLKNAAEAIGERGTIELSLARRNNRLELAIDDSGPGVAAAARGQLFTPFFSTKREGRGLGLTLAREVFEAHHFDFSLEDRPEGGARFQLLM